MENWWNLSPGLIWNWSWLIDSSWLIRLIWESQGSSWLIRVDLGIRSYRGSSGLIRIYCNSSGLIGGAERVDLGLIGTHHGWFETHWSSNLFSHESTLISHVQSRVKPDQPRLVPNQPNHCCTGPNQPVRSRSVPNQPQSVIFSPESNPNSPV